MNVLVACECSGIVRDAFIAEGHNAWSCDLKPTRRPGPHYQGDVRDVLYRQWDLLIAHPTCTYLCNSGVRWLSEQQGRWELMLKGVEFFLLFERATHIPLRAIENPIMHCHAVSRIGRVATQFVQPWWFGDPYSKATGWWLTGLPLLKATHKKSDYPEIKQECHRMPPGPVRDELRSNTYPGHAKALAKQWGVL